MRWEMDAEIAVTRKALMTWEMDAEIAVTVSRKKFLLDLNMSSVVESSVVGEKIQ